MSTATHHIRFGLKSLFGVLTIIAVHLGVYSWHPGLCMVLLFASTFSAVWWYLRLRGATWLHAFVSGAGIGTCVLSLTVGAVSFVVANYASPSSGSEWMWSGVYAFVLPALFMAVYGLFLSGCLLLIMCVAAALRWFVHVCCDKYYILEGENGGPTEHPNKEEHGPCNPQDL